MATNFLHLQPAAILTSLNSAIGLKTNRQFKFQNRNEVEGLDQKGVISQPKITVLRFQRKNCQKVLRGGFSDNLSGNDITYLKGKSGQTDKIISIKPLDDDENSQYTANILNGFLEKVFEVLDKHPVNEERRKKGLLPANYLMLRGAGI